MKGISATKKNCSTSSSDHNLHSKRIKISSNSSKTNITDLPDFLLVEILCRLPCKKFIFQCKLVSNRWCTLLSDLYFIGRFLCLQSETPIKRTMINSEGEEIPKFSKPLTRLFKRLMSFHSLEKEPVVLGTYNDLVLCSATEDYQRDYYICNPYTTKWVPVPPPPQVYQYLPVGLVCDFPYYNYNHKKDDWKGHDDIIHVNAEYRCKIVRILPFKKKSEYGSFYFKVETFSFETGEWRVSIVSSPRGFDFYDICADISFMYNGMLCWPSDVMGSDHNFIIGLDPFMMEDNNSTSTTDGDDITDRYECCFFRLVEENEMCHIVDFLGVSQGCPRMCDLSGHSLYVWELKEAQDQMAGSNRAGKLRLIHPRVYSLDQNMFQDEEITLLHFDPNVKDSLYLRVNNDIAKCNISTGKWSRIAPSNSIYSWHFFPSTELPWPTPVPRLLQHVH
ncbi:hypothetical protein M0R45_032203 [Rubus argutus]|uniref:F-box domain-containing protein n=1 Tax=Rubus argutus TaxID=59490 RepID=A0AAW1WJG7_RUBAR